MSNLSLEAKAHHYGDRGDSRKVMTYHIRLSRGDLLAIRDDRESISIDGNYIARRDVALDRDEVVLGLGCGQIRKLVDGQSVHLGTRVIHDQEQHVVFTSKV